jgi:hypothetical protein
MIEVPLAGPLHSVGVSGGRGPGLMADVGARLDEGRICTVALVGLQYLGISLDHNKVHAMEV